MATASITTPRGRPRPVPSNLVSLSESGRKPFRSSRLCIRPGVYRHFKGNNYRVVGVAEQVETGEVFVIYYPLYEDHSLVLRPLNEFVSDVERDGQIQPRFQYIGESEPASPGLIEKLAYFFCRKGS